MDLSALPPARRPVVFVMGPTAAGKSGLALALATRFPMEIVNADSVQVYRGMDIGTAKPSPAERAQVAHHLLDLVAPDDPFSAGRYRQEALATIAHIHQQGRIPLLTGGTGLYFRVVEQGVAPTPDIPEEIRARITAEAAQSGWPAQHARLCVLDPPFAAGVTPRDSQRILRGLAVVLATGLPLSHWQQLGHTPLPHPLFKIILNRPRPQLYQRIELRFHQMMDDGLLAEAAALLAKGYARTLPAMKAVGYRQLFGHLADGQPLAQAVAAAIQESRHYAKRQLTWLRPEPHALWLDADRMDAAFPLMVNFLKEFGFFS